MTPADSKLAQESFEAAIRKDPGCAGAYSGLADFYLRQRAGLPSAEWYVSAKNATLKALELDPAMADAYVSLADVLFYYEWNWTESAAAARRALQLNPSHWRARAQHAVALVVLGQPDEAVREALRARDLNPMSAEAHTFVGGMMSVSGRHEEAVQWGRKAVAMDPEYVFAHSQLGLYYSRAGQYADAADAYRTAVSRQPRNAMHLMRLIYALGKANRRSEADEAFTSLVAMQERRYVSPYFLAVAHMGLGDHDGALAWLEKAQASRDGSMPSLLPDAFIWSVLRDAPRFRAIVEQMHFPGRHPL
jgi:serine/threonine-protein kinase